MFKTIHRVECSPALAACQQLIRTFSLWLCNPATTPASLTQPGLQPPVLPSAIEADWLWTFLQRVDAGRQLLDLARELAAMPNTEKAALTSWVQSVSDLAAQFKPAPAAWPIDCPLAIGANWSAFRTVIEAFYEKGFRSGLPYLPNGTPVAAGGVTYADFVRAFRSAHSRSNAPHARQVCILCSGPLGDTPHVDHWVTKSAFPLLSVCQDNLTVICSTCNEAPNKGDKPVHSAGNFSNWFHPYLRPAHGTLQLVYDAHAVAVRCSSVEVADHPKAANLNKLLDLDARWTRELKAEYEKHQEILRRREAWRVSNAQVGHTLTELNAYIQQWADDLLPSEPYHEVHATLAQAVLEPSRMEAWLEELAIVQ